MHKHNTYKNINISNKKHSIFKEKHNMDKKSYQHLHNKAYLFF